MTLLSDQDLMDILTARLYRVIPLLSRDMAESIAEYLVNSGTVTNETLFSVTPAKVKKK